MEGFKPGSKVFYDVLEGMMIIHRSARDSDVRAYLEFDQGCLLVGPFNLLSKKMSKALLSQLDHLGFHSPPESGPINAWCYDPTAA